VGLDILTSQFIHLLLYLCAGHVGRSDFLFRLEQKRLPERLISSLIALSAPSSWRLSPKLKNRPMQSR
jgi:hypothetical protein